MSITQSRRCAKEAAASALCSEEQNAHHDLFVGGRSTVRFFVLFGLLLACSADTSGLEKNGIDIREWAYRCEPDPDRLVAPEMSFSQSEGCNQCVCEDCGEDVCSGLCTSALCGDLSAPPSNPAFPRCTNDADCESGTRSGTCLFDAGCDEPVGFCHFTQSTCAGEAMPATEPIEGKVYCGCDGVTYASSCPKVAYRNAGPCL